MITIQNNTIPARYFDCLESVTHCFSFAHGLDRGLEVVTRIFLTAILPIVILGNLLFTTVATIAIFPLYCLGIETHLKNTRTAWILLPLIPIAMGIYLLTGRFFHANGLFILDSKSIPATPTPKPIESPPDLSVLPSQQATILPPLPLRLLPYQHLPIQFEQTPLLTAIAKNNWIQVLSCLALNTQKLASVNITWREQNIAISLLEFFILMTPSSEGLFTNSNASSLLTCLSSLQLDPQFTKTPPEISELKRNFIRLLLNIHQEGTIIPWHDFRSRRGIDELVGVEEWDSCMSNSDYYHALLLAEGLINHDPGSDFYPLFTAVYSGYRRMLAHPFANDPSPTVKLCISHLFEINALLIEKVGNYQDAFKAIVSHSDIAQFLQKQGTQMTQLRSWEDCMKVQKELRSFFIHDVFFQLVYPKYSQELLSRALEEYHIPDVLIPLISEYLGDHVWELGLSHIP